jgi:hypothetical protein
MGTSKDREFEQREVELQTKQRELRLRELEIEIYEQQKVRKPEVVTAEPSLSQTRRHNSTENSIQRFGRNIMKYAKFIGFVVVGIAIVKAGFLIGMWITYLVMAGIVACIGYQLFLKDDR